MRVCIHTASGLHRKGFYEESCKDDNLLTSKTRSVTACTPEPCTNLVAASMLGLIGPTGPRPDASPSDLTANLSREQLVLLSPLHVKATELHRCISQERLEVTSQLLIKCMNTYLSIGTKSTHSAGSRSIKASCLTLQGVMNQS